MSITLTRQQTENMLTKIGAEIIHGAKHANAHLKVNGKHIFLIPISRSSKDNIPIGTAHRIFKQTLLENHEQFMRLRNCPMKKEEYLSIISVQGIV